LPGPTGPTGATGATGPAGSGSLSFAQSDTSTSLTISSNTSVLSTSVTATSGDLVDIGGSVQVSATVSRGAPLAILIRVRVRRVGAGSPLAVYQMRERNDTNGTYHFVLPFSWVDTAPSTGSHTYAIDVFVDNGGTTGGLNNVDAATAESRSLKLRVTPP
jgi:hypothetical protein